MAKNYTLLYGKKSIHERLKVNSQSIRNIFLCDDFNHPQIQALITSVGITPEYLPADKIENMKKVKNLQGIVARVDKFIYSSFEDLLDSQKNLTPVFLDRINDPQNLGVIIRTLACLGGFCIVIPERDACHITEAVMHVASGGENYVQICKVADMTQAINEVKRRGVSVMGAVIDENAEDINSLKLKFPLAIVLGAEAVGIAPEIQKILDKKSYIPMHGAKLTLNVNTACAIFCNEITKQRLADSG
ncbi:MAG: RNA methyltransferase [Candidatus Omnitrophica bacterium]|nr:RNA methyltransferase [Candidatus Omnitrophota bacterium]